MRLIPQNILKHPGFICMLRADSTGSYEQNKEKIYEVLLKMCGSQERLQEFLDGTARNQVQTIGGPSTRFQKCLDVGLGVQVGFNYIETGVVVSGDPQLVVEMSLLAGTSCGSYSIVRMEHGLRGLEETVNPSGSTYFVSVENVFRIKCEVGGRTSYSEPFLVPNRA